MVVRTEGSKNINSLEKVAVSTRHLIFYARGGKFSSLIQKKNFVLGKDGLSQYGVKWLSLMWKSSLTPSLPRKLH